MMWLNEHKRYIVHGITVAGLIGVAGMGVAWSTPSKPKFSPLPDPATPKQAQPEARPAEDRVSAEVYSRVMQLRGEVALTNEDLAALNLTQSQAGDVLTRLVEWVEANEAALIQTDRAVEDTKRDLASLERRVRAGEADAQDIEGLAALRSAVALARAARVAQYKQAGAHALAPAPATTRDQWQAASRFGDLPVELRHLPGVNEQQMADLLAPATDPRPRNQPGRLPGEAPDLREALPVSTVQSMDAVRTRVNVHLPGVRAAEAEALPLPSEFAVEDADSGVVAGETPR